jgi:ubiquinone/menaquinone biosynthesis C-methylase UbiE
MAASDPGLRDDAASFRAPADAYDRLMGRYSRPLAGAFLEAVGVEPGERVLDVGCGPGALTEALAARLGPGRVAAVDPSEPFAAACAARVPGADVRVAAADRLPYDEDAVDATLSQLVVNFLPDAGAGLREMTRVTRPGASWRRASGTMPAR